MNAPAPLPAAPTMRALIRYAEAHRVPTEELGWPAIRFRLQEQAGEPMDIIFRRYRFDGSAVDEELLRHESHDGVGAMTAILEERGWTVPTMVSQRSRRPGLLRQLLLRRRYRRKIRPWPNRWQTEPDWSVKARWPSSAMALFDVERTAAYAEALVGQGASVTSGILSALDRRAAQLLLTSESPRRWMVPVNMRQPGPKRYGNVVTSIPLLFEKAMAPGEVHRELKAMLGADMHWGAAFTAELLGRLSVERTRCMLASFDPRRTIFGVVTNVGSWPPADATPPATPDDDESTWVIVPPVGRRGPLASTMITWRGKLAVTLRVHGCLRLRDDDVRALLQGVADDVAAVAGGAGRGVVFTDPSTGA